MTLVANPLLGFSRQISTKPKIYPVEGVNSADCFTDEISTNPESEVFSRVLCHSHDSEIGAICLIVLCKQSRVPLKQGRLSA